MVVDKMKFLEKYKDSVKKFNKNKGALNDAKNIYNMLCKKCQRLTFVKIKYGKTAQIKHYCEYCQKKIIDRFGEKYD